MSKQIAIITVTYNAEDSIEKTILSVINQTMFNDQIEYIVIDGGSTDKTISILNKYRNHFTHLVSEPDHGIYDAMNKGAKLASSPWILYMNAGDTLFDEQTIEKLHLESRQPNCIVYGDHITTKKGEKEVLTKAAPFWENTELIAGLGICHQSIYMPTEWMKLHPFDWKRYRYCADFDIFHYWHSQRKDFSYVGTPLCRFEQGEGFTSRPEVWLRLLDENAKIVGRRHSFTYYKIRLRHLLGIH